MKSKLQNLALTMLASVIVVGYSLVSSTSPTPHKFGSDASNNFICTHFIIATYRKLQHCGCMRVVSQPAT